MSGAAEGRSCVLWNEERQKSLPVALSMVEVIAQNFDSIFLGVPDDFDFLKSVIDRY